jgi:hypothetical protein
MDIKSLSSEARVWIYQAGKRLSETEKSEILQRANEFVRNWSTHGKILNARAQVLYDVFLVLSVDEGDVDASGCSIDKSLHFIKQLEHDFQISLLDRKTIAILKDGEVHLLDLNTFKSQINAGRIGKDSIIFNNLVNTIHQMETNWKIPVHSSWLKKYLSDN